MKNTLLRFLTSACLITPGGAIAADSAPAHPEKAVRTFYIQGLECGGCVYMVQHALSEAKGVLAHEVVQSLDSYAIVSFNPQRLSEQQVAQTVREAMPVHGTPYLASVRVRFRAFAQSVALVEKALEPFKNEVRMEVRQPERGEVAFHFEPMDAPKAAHATAGWNLSTLRKALDAMGPAGRAVRFEPLDQAPQPQ